MWDSRANTASSHTQCDMPKYRLMTPGPTEVPEAARAQSARQIVHHRTDQFRAVVDEVLVGLKEVFQTNHDTLILASSGTGAMEAAMTNLAPRGSKVIVLESGKFAERWRAIAEAFGIEAIAHEVPWGKAFQADYVARLLEEHSDAVAVFATLSETSTGVGHDIEAIGRVVGPSEALFVVDGISGVGAMECRVDRWDIDVLVVGSQKALMGPPGLAFLAVSPDAWRQIESHPRRAFYFDLLAYRQAKTTGDTPFTPAVPAVLSLAESLRAIRREGIENVWSRVRRLAAATRAGVEALGLRLVAERPAESLTAAYVPEGVDASALLARLYERFGVKLAGGQGRLKGRIIRIGHFGEVDEFDILGALASIELVLVELGQSVTLGAGVAAAGSVLARSPTPPN